MRKTLGIGFVLVLMLAVFPLFSVSADVGPKPSMDFSFGQDFPGPQVTITSGILYECEQADCLDAHPLQEMGPQRFSCKPDSCTALAYGFSPYHRLEIEFSDGKTRQSNIFKTAQFQSTYKVTVESDSLVVKSVFHLDPFTPLTYVLLCGGCLIGIILLIVVIVLIVRRATKKK